MNKIKVAKELVKLAKSLIAFQISSSNFDFSNIKCSDGTEKDEIKQIFESYFAEDLRKSLSLIEELDIKFIFTEKDGNCFDGEMIYKENSYKFQFYGEIETSADFYINGKSYKTLEKAIYSILD